MQARLTDPTTQAINFDSSTCISDMQRRRAGRGQALQESATNLPSSVNMSVDNAVETPAMRHSEGQIEGHAEHLSRNPDCSDPIPLPASSRKRRNSRRSESISLSYKRSYLTKKKYDHSTEDDKEVKQRQSIHQPVPIASNYTYPSFLEEPSVCAEGKSAIAQWIESTTESESLRNRNSRSDSFLVGSESHPKIHYPVDTLFGPPYNDHILRKKSKSLPPMPQICDLSGFAMPATPRSASFIASSATSSARSSKRSLIENPWYRVTNLAANNIILQPLRRQFPDGIAGLVARMSRDRDSPGPSLDEAMQDADLNCLWMGSMESDVENYFQSTIFPKRTTSNGLQRADRLPMARLAIPEIDSNHKVSGPVPDMLYGYGRQSMFSEKQQAMLIAMGNDMAANSQDLLYPFLVVEFKSDGPSGDGSLWIATNQCLGASAACVNIVERLNYRLQQHGNISPVDSATFSIAMSGTEARLYVSWKHDGLKYYTASVKNFLLHDPEHYLAFHKYVRNILDWGIGARLNDIRMALNALIGPDNELSADLSIEAAPDLPMPHVQNYTDENDPSSQLLVETAYYAIVRSGI